MESPRDCLDPPATDPADLLGTDALEALGVDGFESLDLHDDLEGLNEERADFDDLPPIATPSCTDAAGGHAMLPPGRAGSTVFSIANARRFAYISHAIIIIIPCFCFHHQMLQRWLLRRKRKQIFIGDVMSQLTAP